MNGQQPIINCHAHVFTGDHVPPYLAKTFLPAPLYYLLPVSLVVRLFRFWYNYPYTWQFQPWYKKIASLVYRTRVFIARVFILSTTTFLIGMFLAIQTIFIAIDTFSLTGSTKSSAGKFVVQQREWLSQHKLLIIPDSMIGKLLLVLILIIFFKSGRNMVWFVLKKVFSILNSLPGPQSRELAERYLNIGRFAFYKQQTRVFGRLKNQYPGDTGFVLLPMDMEYMGAGRLKPNNSYARQMAALRALKDTAANKDHVFPFVFADPRRMVDEGPAQFNYTVKNGQVVLGDCFIKQYIEDEVFSGFKIYPALGYYPFDENLLPLWKYAADAQLPITTHCIRGTIYYRGRKKKEWDTHPVFEESKGADKYGPLLLPEIKNREFINNFTHPLNYLCLLDESLLRKLVAKARDPRIREIFGYQDEYTPMLRDLSHLKLCLGHFGGDDEWRRFMELDRDNYASQLVKNPMKGISFLTNDDGEPTPGKPELLWKYTDWYSIICSLMLQYPNVYGDISYILHNPEIHPLLKQTILHPVLGERMLFGTDFYVVRNHKSDKNMLADMLGHLDAPMFSQIARLNPRKFLNSRLHGPVLI